MQHVVRGSPRNYGWCSPLYTSIEKIWWVFFSSAMFDCQKVSPFWSGPPDSSLRSKFRRHRCRQSCLFFEGLGSCESWRTESQREHLRENAHGFQVNFPLNPSNDLMVSIYWQTMGWTGHLSLFPLAHLGELLCVLSAKELNRFVSFPSSISVQHHLPSRKHV